MAGRSEVLNGAFEKAVSRTLEQLSEETFQNCFPNVQKEVLESARAQICEKLKENIMNEYVVVRESRDLEEKLKTVDRLVEENKRKKVKREEDEEEREERTQKKVEGNEIEVKYTPQEYFRAESLPLRTQELQESKEKLERLNAENQDIISKIQDKKKILNQLAGEISRKRKSLDSSSKECSKVSIPTLKNLFSENNSHG